MDSIQIVANVISQIGFPIFISCYLIIRLDKKLDTISGSLLKILDKFNNDKK